MTADHTSYEELAAQGRDSADYREGYAEAQRAYLIGRAVRDRRLALGLSRTDLAAGTLPPRGRRRHPHHPPVRPHLHRPRRRPHRRDRATRRVSTATWALFAAVADVRTPSQASTMVPWHGRQTMEIEDDSNPEDDA